VATNDLDNVPVLFSIIRIGAESHAGSLQKPCLTAPSEIGEAPIPTAGTTSAIFSVSD